MMETKFAKAERADQKEVLRQRASIEQSDFLASVMADTPFMFFILNEDRQVVFSNHRMLIDLGYSSLGEIAGSRPGEIFRCVHSCEEPGGCGTSADCRFCGAILTVLNSKKENRLVVGECVINIEVDGEEKPMNFEISSKPFRWKGDDYFVVTMQDISEKKRKEQLERVFFHDLLNKAGNISMFMELLGGKFRDVRQRELFETARFGVREMVEDIQYQNKIQQAEKGTLTSEKVELNTRALVNYIIKEYEIMAGHWGLELVIDRDFLETSVHTDPVLIKRILGNLVKNAIEASGPAENVEINCRSENGHIVFSVYNHALIPRDVQPRIFDRAFSTKGQGRGIGTYSVKMFTEQYLGGTVAFTSEEGMGTVFYVRIPHPAAGE